MRLSLSTIVSRSLLTVCLIFAGSDIIRCQSYGRISTLAGTGSQGYSGDGGPASEAMLNFPQGVAIDSQGNFYFADALNYRIRKVEVSSRIITTVAGGSSGFAGDGGPATSARLNQPTAVALDAAGNLYIADLVNDRIRRVDRATGIITTFAGGGAVQGDGGPATDAILDGPRDVAVDAAGNVYVVEQYARRVRRVDGNTGIITTIAGTGSSGSTGDGGPATQATLWVPGVAVIPATYLLRPRRVPHPLSQRRNRNHHHLCGHGLLLTGGDGGPAVSAGLNGPSESPSPRTGTLWCRHT